MSYMPRFLRGARRPAEDPPMGWDNEIRAIEGMAEWLAKIESKEGQYRALSYLMWRLKSGDNPRMEDWVESIAEQSVMKVAREHGFKEGVE